MIEEKRTFQLHTGAIADSIAKQVKRQGLTFKDPTLAARFQKIADSIIMLRFHGYLPDSQSRKMEQKLCKEVGKSLTLVQ
jgi:hypothetical protein